MSSVSHITLRCNDCGGTADIEQVDVNETLVRIYAFAEDHRSCSESLTVVPGNSVELGDAARVP